MIAGAALSPLALWGSSCALEGFNRVEADAPLGCPHATVPPPPSVTGSGGDIEIIVAVRAFDLGELETDAGSAPVGFDLDRTCTCQGEGPNCTPLADAGADASAHCDAPEGRDNAAARIFKLLTSAFGEDGFGSAFYSAKTEEGAWSVLLRVRGYNGEPDDDRVQFDWYVATNFSAGGNVGAPQWDGEDAWPILSSALNRSESDAGTALDSGVYNPEDTRFTDPNAYVTGGVLVAALPEAEITLSGGVNTISILVSGGTLSATIEPAAVSGGYLLRDAIFGGRWKTSEVFRSLSTYRSNDGKAYCKTDPFYPAAKSTLCGSADILDRPGSPTLYCDSISIGIRFQTFPARIGAILDPAPPSPGCMPAAFSPENDACKPPAP